MKGQFKALEASIAAIILISFVAWSLKFTFNAPETESLDLSIKVLRALKVLDENNELRGFVYLNDTKAIEEKLYPYIPKSFNYKVIICDNYCFYSIESDRVYSVSYFLASNLNNFENREVLVYVWKI
jgi:hypothetical protein